MIGYLIVISLHIIIIIYSWVGIIILYPYICILISLYASGQKNHLSGLHKPYLKLSFDTVQQLIDVKSDLLHVVQRNQEKFDVAEAYESIIAGKR